MLGTEVMPGILDSLLIHGYKNSLSREALGVIAVCFSCDELMNSSDNLRTQLAPRLLAVARGKLNLNFKFTEPWQLSQPATGTQLEPRRPGPDCFGALA